MNPMNRALLVGINEYPTPHPKLKGCVNDVEDMADYLVQSMNYSYEAITPLYDGRATKKRITDELRSMIASSVRGDHLLFYFSGHGAQILSFDFNEPDGVDEVICPVDFDWGNLPSSALTDNELGSIISMVPAGVALTLIIDACHSGDLARGLGDPSRAPRFLPPPPDIARRMKGKARKRILADKSIDGTQFSLVSACESAQVAADTSFDGRANGAFSYFWMKRLKAGKGKTLGELLAEVAADLKSFNMTPTYEGSPMLRESTFLISPPPSTRALVASTQVIRSRDAVVFEEKWQAPVLGMNIGVQVQILGSSDGFIFNLTCMVGIPLTWSFRIGGDTTQQVDLGYGIRLVLAINGWAEANQAVNFNLAISVAPPFFLPAITIVNQPITIPLSVEHRAIQPPLASAADFLALVQYATANPRLPKASPRSAPKPVRSREEGAIFTYNTFEIPFVGGLFGMSYNLRFGDMQSADYHISWGNGKLRREPTVRLDPPGSGNVYFTPEFWLDEDETRCNFIIHFGVTALWRGTAYITVNYTNGDILSPPIVKSIGGNASSRMMDRDPAEYMQELGEELAMENPEGGGSIRA
jgi:hypothetical protein